MVQGHLGDPVGENTKSEKEESSLPQWMGAVSGWESRDRRQDKGDKPHTPAGPAARSCPSTVPEHPGWEWGSQKKGRGYRQRLHQAQSCMGRGLAGTRSLARALAHWHQVRQGSRPLPWWGGWENSSTPLTGMPEKMGSPREAQEHSPGSPWKEKSFGLKWQRHFQRSSGSLIREVAWALGMDNPQASASSSTRGWVVCNVWWPFS